MDKQKYKIPRCDMEKFKEVLPEGWEFTPDEMAKEKWNNDSDAFLLCTEFDTGLLLIDGRITKNYTDLGNYEDGTVQWGTWVNRLTK